jgi:signal transduction histidine kinase
VTTSPGARRIGVGAEVALAAAAGVVSFVLVAVVLSVADSDVVAVILAVAAGAAVLEIAHRWGAAYAIPAAVLALVAYDWFVFPPTHPEEFPDRNNLLSLLAYIAIGTVAGELAAYGARRAASSEAARALLADEQAALRRVATVVARGASREEVFEAIAREVGLLVGVEEILMMRYEDERSATVLATAMPLADFARGSRQRLGGENLATRVRETGEPARIDDFRKAGGPIGEKAREVGLRSAVGTPIVVEGRLWGVLVTGTHGDEPLPPDTEARVSEFTDLMGTAIANTESQLRAERLAAEQAALRRVATLVAKDAPPAEIFAKVAEEAAELLGTDCTIWRDDGGGAAGVVAVHGSRTPAAFPVGTEITLEGDGVTESVLREGRPHRVDDYATDAADAAEGARELGVTSAVGQPVIVHDRTWGAIVVASLGGSEPCPPDTEARLAPFADLVATAIANADARTELADSRTRLLAAADDARRRVVRDLHDGAQQRLVHSIITLKLAQRALGGSDGEATALVDEALEHAQQGNAELRELAHGILPAVLTRGGLRAGVDTVVDRISLPVDVDIADGRFDPEIEASAYFIVAEALTNVVKHAHAAHAEVRVHVENGTLQVEVGDDGAGGADPAGSGLVGLGDRATALGGRLSVESPPGSGTRLTAELPLHR